MSLICSDTLTSDTTLSGAIFRWGYGSSNRRYLLNWYSLLIYSKSESTLDIKLNHKQQLNDLLAFRVIEGVRPLSTMLKSNTYAYRDTLCYCVAQKQLGCTPFPQIHNTLWSAVNMSSNLHQLYQFTIEFKALLLSSDGPEQVNYSIHNPVCGIKFQKTDTDGSRGPPSSFLFSSVSHVACVSMHE